MAYLDKAIAENRVPTAAEMDEVDLTDPDHDTVMIMCYEGHWNKWLHHEAGKHPRVECQTEGCDSRLYQSRTIVSLRSWNPARKPKKGE
jgi:hypothetical protein